jgi:glycosyltransferase involved in cell wall biosynthesis
MSRYGLLIYGSVPVERKPQTYGGTTVLMQNFIEFLDEEKINYKLIKLNRFNFKGSFILNFINMIIMMVFYTPFSSKVMFNAASNGTFYIAPLVYFYSKFFGKKFIFRKFGGGLVELITTKNKFLAKLFFKTVIKSDLLFTETKKLVEYISNFSPNSMWFPNVRKINSKSMNCNRRHEFNKRFVFISHIKKTKGVVEIIKVFENLDKSYNVDLYGPNKDDVLSNIILPQNVNYKGTIEPNEVIDTLNNYDVLLLPTYHEGEGYPGIIIEAFSQSTPVISTEWKSIPEIVDRCSGILITPKSIKELKSAVLHFNEDNYNEFCLNAKKQFQNFNSEIVNKRIINTINTL